MKRLRKLFFAVLAWALSMPVMAQITLEECQQLAQENYPLLQKYSLIRQTTGFTVKNIRRGYLPKLALTGQASYMSDVTTLPEALATTMSQAGNPAKGLKKDQYRIGIDASLPLYDGGTIRAKSRLTKAQGAVEERQTDTEMYAIRNRINDLYFGILLLDERLLLNASLQELLEDNSRKLNALVRGGVAMQADADALQAELLNTKQDATALTAMRQSYKEVLQLFIGRPLDGKLVKPSASMPDLSHNFRPELSLFEAQLNTTEARKKLIDTGLLPNVSLMAQGYYGYPGMDMFHDMFSHKWTLNGSIGIRLSWNISNFYTRKNDREKLNLSALQITNARDVFLFNNRLTATQQDHTIRQYRRMMKEDEEIIRLRQSVRTAAEAKLAHGTIDVNDLLQELTRENQARISRSAHEIEMLKAIHELKITLNQ